MGTRGPIRISWRASRLTPCPVCGGGHSCSVASSGLVFCWRRHVDQPGWIWLKDAANGFGMFLGLDADPVGTSSRTSIGGTNGHTNGHVKPERPRVESAQLTDYLRDHPAGPLERASLADVIGVRADTLRQLRMGFVTETERESSHWIFPERDDLRRVIGLLRRYPSGQKLQYTGSRRGLAYDPDWEPDPAQGTVLVVEGPTDVAAALTLGLHAVGRPNNVGGVDVLADFLGRFARLGGEVIVLGENDRKADGAWPGREGAEKVATGLAEKWGRAVGFAMPPENAKDLRDWLWASGSVNVEDVVQCADLGKEIIRLAKCGLTEIRHREFSRDLNCLDYKEIYREGGVGGEGIESEDPARNSLCRISVNSHQSSPLSDPATIGPSTRQVLDTGAYRRPCKSHTTPLLQGRNCPSKGLAIRADRWAFDCPQCGPRKRSCWLVHLMCLFDALPAGDLNAGVIADGKPLALLQRRIRRAKANYVAISTRDGAVTVATDRSVETGFASPGTSIDPTTAPQAVELAAHALLNLASTRKPVTTSRAWKLPEPEFKGDYIRRGSAGRGAFSEVVACLERRGLRPRTAEMPLHSERADWVFPDGKPEEEIDWVFEVLSEVGYRTKSDTD